MKTTTLKTLLANKDIKLDDIMFVSTDLAVANHNAIIDLLQAISQILVANPQLVTQELMSTISTCDQDIKVSTMVLKEVLEITEELVREQNTAKVIIANFSPSEPNRKELH